MDGRFWIEPQHPGSALKFQRAGAVAGPEVTVMAAYDGSGTARVDKTGTGGVIVAAPHVELRLA